MVVDMDIYTVKYGNVERSVH